MSIFVLKLIAVFFMIVDHIKYAIPSCMNEFTLYFGRIAFPIFAFCIVQGYIHTHDIKKYLMRLFIAGLISEIPFLLFNSIPILNHVGLNVLFTFFLGLIAIKIYDSCKNKFIGILILILIGILSIILKVDYGIFGIFLIFSFYLFKDCKWKTCLFVFCVISMKYLYRSLILKVGFTEYLIKNWICTASSLVFIILYNGKKGYGMKYLFYIIYPLQFLVLYFIYCKI